MEQTFWIVDTNSGDKLKQITPASGSHTPNIPNIGDGSHVLQLRDDDGITMSEWRELTQTWSRTIVAEIDGHPDYAGLIRSHTYDHATGELTVSHQEVRGLLARRFPFMVPTFTPAGTTSVSGKSLRGIARRIIEIGAHSTPGDAWHLPVVLGDDEAGGESRTWFWYEFPIIEDMLVDVQNVDGGPDIYLRPRWSGAGRLEWALELGTPRLNAGTYEYHLDAPDDPVTKFQLKTDGSKRLTGVFAIGKGSEAGTRVGKAGGADIAPTPIAAPNMDGSRPFKHIENVGELDMQARAQLRTYAAAPQVVSFNLTDVAPPVGSTLRVYVEDRDDDRRSFVAPGWYEGYVLSRTVTYGSADVQLEMA